jgi:hypothetical protein
MDRLIAVLTLGTLLLAGGLVDSAWSAEEKVLQTYKSKDVVITLKSESGQWSKGRNAFVLEFTSAKDKQAVDAGKVSLGTSMTMSGMAPMIAGATLSPDRTPGRYLGTIEFADTGTRQVTVTWEGPAGTGSARFSVPVR